MRVTHRHIIFHLRRKAHLFSVPELLQVNARSSTRHPVRTIHIAPCLQAAAEDIQLRVVELFIMLQHAVNLLDELFLGCLIPQMISQ